MIETWSHNRLNVYEACGYHAYLAYDRKIKEPPKPPDHPANAGIRIHQECEDFVCGKGELTHAMRKLKNHFYELRAAYEAGQIQLEGEWAFDRDWQPTGWWDKNVWGRVKLDAYHNLGDGHGKAIDYKSGKRFGNEVKHNRQMQEYAVASFMRIPDLDLLTAELWYLDLGTVHPKTYTRTQAMKFLPRLNQRAETMTGPDADFSPRANKHNCRFCPYKPSELGECEYGID